MAVDEIRTLLRFCGVPDNSCGEVNTLLDEHIGHVASRIAELKSLEKRLRNLRSLCRSTQQAR